MKRLALLALPVALGLLLCSTASARAPGFTAKLGQRHASSTFVVTYRGSGHWATTYHSTPPNPGGNPDTNDAHDSSTQSWRLTFLDRLVVPRCSSAAGGRRRGNPCAQITSLNRVSGTARVSGSIDHVHLDGLFAYDNVSERCSVSAATPPAGAPSGTVQVRFVPARNAIAVTALNPVANALVLLPSACPGQGDSVDGIQDNYFSPGFSFNSSYGPDRWFTAATIMIPISTLHRATMIRIPLTDTRAGTPPRGCDVPVPSYERCTTGGEWSGVLTLRAV